jgi:signal transduction histidine kinase
VQKSIEHSFFRRLSTSLLITLTLLSAVPLILVVFFMRSVAIESTREIIRNQNRLIAKRAANEIKLFLNTPDILLSLLSGIKDVKDMNPRSQTIIINKVLEDYHPIFNKVFVIDKSGKVISTSGQKVSSETYANESFFIHIVEGKHRYITHVKFDDAQNPFIIFSYPIVQSGHIIGVLAGEVNIERIWKLVDEIKIGKTGNAFIIGSTGQAIAHPNKYNVMNEIRVLGDNIIDEIKKNSEISLVFDTPQGETMLGTFVHIRDFEWTMAIQQPVNDYSDVPSALLYYEVLAFIILVILIAVLIASLLKRRITEPINSLISGVKRYAEGDLSFRINIERYEEIAVLAEEFNTMASNLYKNQEKLRGVERLAAMSRFATLVSHEIRNPLNSMNINMKILKREIDNPKGDIEKKQKYFNIITSEINRMDNLIKNFLIIARPPRFDFVLNDMHGILEEVILLHRENSKQQNVSIKKEFQDGKSIANVDRDQMKQVFHNIIINALQAMPGGGELRIQTRFKKMDTSLDQNIQFIRIKFIDTGIGIPEDKIRDIFEIYYTMKKTGTGLGLAIARQIVEGHFGSIDVKSKVGEGTTITVSIPKNSDRIRSNI